MQISYNWLSDYLPEKPSIEELSTILTGIGLEVESIEKKEAVPGSLEGLIIGAVESCVPHPNADKLKLTVVSTGTERLSVVCGAPNVSTGQKVVLAPAGTWIHPVKGEKIQIKKTRIRGAVSEGMICAEDEIGLGAHHDGIIVLPADTVTGIPAKDYFRIPPPDFIFHIGLTPNRSDANSHLGVAKDVCAYLTYHRHRNIAVRFPEQGNMIASGKKLPFSIEIEAQEACPRYAGIAISGVTVAPSPAWLQERLRSIGIHPVNNVVDITNFVLQEYGQPLHAFDYDKIADSKIIVKKLAEGTKFTTLDGRERTLRNEDLMICDARGPLCMAGIFGGAASGISAVTKNVFLESAYFDPRTIRRSSVHHDLRTEAATHFEKGVAMRFVLPALKRAAELLVSVAGGSIASDISDQYPMPLPPREIILKQDYLTRICGKAYSAEDTKAILAALSFDVKADASGLTVSVPAENLDIHHPADLAEEVLRIDGLDKIHIPDRIHISLNKNSDPSGAGLRTLKERIAEYLAYSGLSEIVTNSITNSRYYPGREQIVHLLNNLSSELDIMRPEMLESGLEVIQYNANRKIQDLKLFEFGKTYFQKAPGAYGQEEHLSIWISGNRSLQHWQQKAQKADFYYLKGILQRIFTLSGLEKYQEEVSGEILKWTKSKREVARMYTVPGDKLKAFDIRQDVFYAEIHIRHLFKSVEKERVQYHELPKYPSMKRDLALVLEKNIPYEKIAAVVHRQKWDALRDFELFDIFEHEKLGKNKKSLALSFTFQVNDRTLTDEEVDAMMQQIIADCEKDLQASVRS